MHDVARCVQMQQAPHPFPLPRERGNGHAQTDDERYNSLPADEGQV